ncbi:hypothetical protein IU433_19540 [Nocardia puris]|uniref:AvrD family protein n=1 Tax=Nocardia puris TaxID=208602 RepID=UPI002B4B867F|nr:AvrD family protein [Nocardia puris]MBF6461228.1 hypothetical protein [Nocardia puris]
MDYSKPLRVFSLGPRGIRRDGISAGPKSIILLPREIRSLRTRQHPNITPRVALSSFSSRPRFCYGVIVMTTCHLRADHAKPIDALLGNRAQRYFGDGFRQGTVRFTRAAATDPDENARCVGFGSLEYPGMWSLKSSGPQSIHVSTIDTYLLAVSAASSLLETTLLRGRRRGDDPLGSAWVRRCIIKAGTVPIEMGLDRIPVSATRINSSDAAAGRVHVISVTVGNMLAILDIDTGSTVPPQSATDVPRSYRGHATDLAGVTVAPDFSSVSADAEYRTVPGPAESYAEIESRFPGSVTFAEAFVDMLQLGQVGLYAMDGFARADSNTLWMRSTHYEATTPIRPRESGERVTTEIHGARVVTLKGRRWRAATLVSHRPSMTLSCSVAHALPDISLGKVGHDDSAAHGIAAGHRRVRSVDPAHQ